LDTLTSRNLTQRVNKPTHRDGGTLDLLAHVEGSVMVSELDVIDARFSDHHLLTTVISPQLPQPDLIHFAFRKVHSVDPVLCSPSTNRCLHAATG